MDVRLTDERLQGCLRELRFPWSRRESELRRNMIASRLYREESGLCDAPSIVFSSVICRFNLKPKTVIYGAAREGIRFFRIPSDFRGKPEGIPKAVWLVRCSEPRNVASAAVVVVVVVLVAATVRWFVFGFRPEAHPSSAVALILP